jgi:hypothetical protein
VLRIHVCIVNVTAVTAISIATMSALDQPYGDTGAKRELAELALRMWRCGVSRWHPDLVAPREAAEAEQRRPAS